MPIMPRCNKKAERIAFTILGTPGNMKKRSNKKNKEIAPNKPEKAEESVYK